MNKDQLRDLIIRVLRELDAQIRFSDEAVEMLMMIAAHESHLGRYLRQVRGPALGLFQIEPRTEQSIYDNYFSYRPERLALINSYKTASNLPDLEFNLAYQIALARIHLTRKPGALPRDPVEMAKYLKKHWNTVHGEATWQEYYDDYNKRAIDTKWED